MIKRVNSKLYFVFLICSIISIILLLSPFNDIENLSWLFLLPFSYFVFTTFLIFYIEKYDYYQSIIFYVFMIVVFARFVVSPLSTILNDRNIFYVYSLGYRKINHSILIMIGEMFFVYMLTYYRIKNSKRRIISYKKISLKKYNQINIFVLFMFVIVFLPLILLFNPSSLVPKNLTSISRSSDDISASLDGAILILSNSVRICILIISLHLCKRNHEKSNNWVWTFISLLIVALYLSTTIYTARLLFIFNTVTCVFILRKLYPSMSKNYIIIIFVIVVFVFFKITFYRYQYVVNASSTPIIAILKMLSQSFDNYFSGIINVANGINMSNLLKDKITIFTFINDFLGSTPYISNFIDQTNRANYLYNYDYLGHNNTALIIPLVANSYMYFKAFPFIYSIFMQYVILNINDKLEFLTLEYSFIYTFIGSYFAMYMGFNSQILFGKYVDLLFPMLLLFNLNKKISKVV